MATDPLQSSDPSDPHPTEPGTVVPSADPPGGAAPLAMPPRLGRYVIEKPLGHGSMGAVYLAHDKAGAVDRLVAVKVLRARLGERPEIVERFRREVTALTQVDHPNVCPIVDAGETEGISYLVMPYIQGRSLAQLIQERPPSVTEAVELVRRLAVAMDAVHRKGVLHRDLKPSNVIVREDGEPIIMDFGLARFQQLEASTITAAGAPIGTPAYMAPEQIEGRTPGPAADIYSLGVILYQLLTGRLPFQGAAAAVMTQVLFDEPRPPSLVRAGVDLRLEGICLLAMDKRMASRFATMNDFADALTEVLQHGPLAEPPPIAASPGLPPLPPIALETLIPPAEPPSSPRAPLRVGCGVVALLIALVALVVISQLARAAMEGQGPFFGIGYVVLESGTAVAAVFLALRLLLRYRRPLFDRVQGMIKRRAGSVSDRSTPVADATGSPVPVADAPGSLMPIAHDPGVPPDAWQPPAVVGGYRVGELIGRGATAEVYRGEHMVLGSPAALKIFHTGAGQPANRLQRALREATIAARLKHPRIVPVYNAGQEAGYFFVVMEYVAGGHVAQLIPNDKGLPVPRALAIARDVAGALQYLHQRGLVHRDVKPSNILLDADCRALLSDFGSLKDLQNHDSAVLTLDGELVGTPAYMAPEQALGEPITPAADLYGFGCLLYFLVTGRDVFRGNTMAVLGQQMHAPPAPPRTLNPDLPSELEQLILDLLQKQPGRRPGDMAAVLARLAPAPGDEGRMPAIASDEPEALRTMLGLPAADELGADESMPGFNVFAFVGSTASSVQTIVPLQPIACGVAMPQAAVHIRLRFEAPPPEPSPPVQAVPLDALKALARDGKLQRVPALAAILRQHLAESYLAAYLRAQPECAVYRDPGNLEEFLFETRGNPRERILGDLFNLRELGQILDELGVPVPPTMSKDERIQAILEALGFRRLVLPDGIESFLRDLAVGSRGVEAEHDPLRLLGIGTKIFLVAERALKDLVHFYGHWLHGAGYLDELRRRGWVPGHAKSVLKLALGSLNQSFWGLAEEAEERPECRPYFAGGSLLPAPLVRRLQALEPHRNRVFSHDAPETRHLGVPELRAITREARDATQALFQHLRAGGVFPRKLVLDRKVEDRHGQVSYCCLSDLNDEVEVITANPLVLGQVYLCLSASNPKYVNPVLVPEPTPA